MHVCMIVCNSGTRDGRVMREARTLRAAGHAVTIIGVPESGAERSTERLSDGIGILRVHWHARAKRRLLTWCAPRGLLLLAILAGIGYALYAVATSLFGQHGPFAGFWVSVSELSFRAARLGAAGAVSISLLALLCLYALWRVAVWRKIAAVQRRRRNDEMRREAISGADCRTPAFPAIRSRIPDWIPDWALAIVEPLTWVGAGRGKFSMNRYRSNELAAAAIALNPDVVHCHDCVALPAGWLAKKALGIPLIYDAHEIYEAVASRRLGATDYFARVHNKYLPRIDGFVAVNDSAAAYYRQAYPNAPAAVVIRNATDSICASPYDGRLHRAAGLPPNEKILLYQGGFTRDRGLPTLVRSAALLPDGWSLAMMGWGPMSGELERIAAVALENGATKTAHFLPAVPSAELLSWTQGAAAGIVPYENTVLNHWIATPNKLWEYPSAGVPLVVQPFPEMRRIVETYRCGWLLPDNFVPSAIGETIAALSEEDLAEARAGCRKFIEADSWSSIYRDRLLALYEEFGRGARAEGRQAGSARDPAVATLRCAKPEPAASAQIHARF